MPTTGSPSEVAVANPVTRLELPGPEVTNATPAFPVMRPIPPAMNAAFCSCRQTIDRKSTRLNSSHQIISYAVFCLKKKKSICAGYTPTGTDVINASGLTETDERTHC